MGNGWELEVAIAVSRKYKEIKNGNGTTVQINQNDYISIGRSGEDIMLRCKEKVLAFQTWEQFVNVVDSSKCSYNRMVLREDRS